MGLGLGPGELLSVEPCIEELQAATWESSSVATDQARRFQSAAASTFAFLCCGGATISEDVHFNNVTFI